MGSSGSDLPQDVVEDILSRLPAKSIMRFSRDDIIQKALISLHPNLDSDSGVELLNLDGMPFFKGDMKEEEQEQLDILGDRCINGLICLYNYPLRYQHHPLCDNLFRIVLWNPAIREFKHLPTNPVHCPSHVQHVFEGFGFGYDHKSNDYKVVRIVSFWDFTPYIDWNRSYCPPPVEVYTLSTDSWKQIDAIFESDAGVHDCARNSQFYLNGAYHWHGYIDEKPSDAIVSFNMTDEVTKKIFDIWVMREYGVKESWTKQFVIGPLSGIQFPLGFTMNDELLMVARDGQLVSYNSNAQEINSLQVRAT
uniref:Uncharacterized protein n=1 Tax=Fagus sylvatica TaxID=28930 RepID=A0A2N9EZY2_FAGSY